MCKKKCIPRVLKLVLTLIHMHTPHPTPPGGQPPHLPHRPLVVFKGRGETREGRLLMGDDRGETVDGRRERGDGRWETVEGRLLMGDETGGRGDGRWETRAEGREQLILIINA